MEDGTFNDVAFLKYCERERELQEDTIENQTIPQYINNLNEQALQNPDVIYISSDESEDEEIDASIPNRYAEALNTSDNEYENSYSDSSYYTCYTRFYSSDTRLTIDEEMTHLDIGSSSMSVRHITDSTNDVIVIEDDDSEVEFAGETYGPSKRRRHKVEKRTKKDDCIRVIPEGIIPNSVCCTECGIFTTRSELEKLTNFSYVRGRRQPYCLGCSRLHSFVSCDEVSDTIKWFVTGKNPSYDSPPVSDYQSMMRRLCKRRKHMEERVERNRSDGSKLVTTNELYRICLDSHFRCAVTGHYLYFHSGQYDRVPWSEMNIQLLSAVLNTIKGHAPNEELVRWYTYFMRSKLIIL
ncbi:hypothetical protein INT48_007778 [Thamnidium elegans]|uniref:Uncharacterized protein n=1 Tax=Thamnidium elegans TaxID=101142 RepID=A0A8H7SFY2_9FUNG|nr:hypothetical protein INT48_007778 [Thamnidium elegans]